MSRKISIAALCLIITAWGSYIIGGVIAETASIKITSPVGGESLEEGSKHKITWTTTGIVDNVKLEYLSEKGGTWRKIVDSTPNNGNFLWTVPDEPSTTCLVRATDTKDGKVTDTCDDFFSIVSAASGEPEISVNRDQLYFGAVVPGSSPPSQAFLIDNAGSGNLNWTASGDAGWLACTPASGTGSGEVTVTVNPSGLAGGTYSSAITVSDPNASNSPRVIDVDLTIYRAGQDSPPFGQFATPEYGATVSSSVPVTGWALDDVGVASVKIYRAPLGGEGSGRVYIGDALTVEGARPDIEAGYPGYPGNYKAGWGYMMLTNFLPNQGNGTFTLYAVVTDGGGRETTLGAVTITCDNANAVKPFGAIDTPVPGSTASGGDYRNHGWVLTPMPNNIPTDGSTIMVYVDGVALGHPSYNIYRDDIAALFPGYANSDGAHAYFNFDTTAYTNGLHTIFWTAEDSAGNSDGIGSRYFSIQNSSAGARSRGVSAQRSAGNWGKGPVVPDDGLIRIKKGFKAGAGPQRVYPDRNGTIVVDFEPLERLELCLAPPRNTETITGYQLVGGTIRALPIGSFLDAERGVFYWYPGAGFRGEFRLVFEFADKTGIIEKRNVLVKI